MLHPERALQRGRDREPDGPLGSTSGPKLQAYRGVLADGAFREQIGGLLRKNTRDHERFSSTLTPLETPSQPRSSSNNDNASADGDDNTVERAAYACPLSEVLRPGAPDSPPPTPPPDSGSAVHDVPFEARYSVLLCSARSSVPPRLSVVSRAIRSFYLRARWPKESS